MFRRSDRDRLNRRMKRFLGRKGPRGGKGRHRIAYAREAESLAFDVLKTFEQGGHRLEDMVAHYRQLIRKRLGRVAKNADQEIGAAILGERETWEAAETWRERYQLEEIHPSDAPDRRTYRGIIALIVTVEVLGTAVFLGNEEANVLFGLVKAMLPAAVTLLLALLTVKSILRMMQPETWKRVTGALMATLGIMGGLLTQLLAGHFREDQGAFLERMLATPFDLSGGAVWLWLGGTVAFVFLVYEIHRAHDPLFTYGDRLRDWHAAKQAVPTAIRSVQNQIESAIDGTDAEAERELSRCRQGAGRAAEIVETSLRRLGLLDKQSWTLDGDVKLDPATAALIEKRAELETLNQQLYDIGDMCLLLARREGEPLEGPPQRIDVDELVDAVSLTEGLGWLRDRCLPAHGLGPADLPEAGQAETRPMQSNAATRQPETR